MGHKKFEEKEIISKGLLETRSNFDLSKFITTIWLKFHIIRFHI
jgi:hypothetical protein